MTRPLPFGHRRIAEEAVRRGLVAALVMEAAAREWAGADDAETFPAYLERRGILAPAAVAEMEAAVAGEPAGEAPAGEGAAETARPAHPAEVIKGYRLLDRLGRGGMGSVYRAEQVGMNRQVAIKILRRPLAENEEHVARLQREARLVGTLDHPNIVRGLEVGQHGPYHYFVMEFVEGETLRDLLKKRGVIPEAEALRLVEEIVRALDHGHSRGIVHRDVKPGNIIVTPEGVARLADFGLAKGPADFTLTQSGVTVGTPQYISPEQSRDPTGVDIQTDIYSLGATAYHMLTGVPPHTSDTLANLLTKVLYEKPRTARQVNPRVSAGASFLVEKMMAKQKRHRYREPRDVLRDLRALAAGRTIVPRDWAGDFEVHEVRRKYRRAVAGAVVLAVLGVAGTAILQVQADRARKRAMNADFDRDLEALVRGNAPRTREGWDERLRGLEDLLRAEAFREAARRSAAEAEREEAQRHLEAWRRADGILLEASKIAGRKRFAEACAYLRAEAATLVAGDGRPYGRFPETRLQEEIRDLEFRGRAAADIAVKRAREEAERVPVLPDTPGIVAALLRGAADHCRNDLLEAGAETASLQELDALLKDLNEARAAVEDARFGSDWNARLARRLAARDFASVEEDLAAVARGIAEDARLQYLLGRIPAPAAESLRGRPDREREALLAANRAVLAEAVREAAAKEAAGDAAGAIEWLEQAESHSVRALRPEIAALRKEVADRREKAERETAEAERALLDGWFADVARRDHAGALRRGEAGARGPLREAHHGIVVVGRCLEEQAFEPVRRLVREGGAIPELRFEEGSRQRYVQVSKVRLLETESGTLLVFDEPGQPGLRGALHALSLDVLLRLSGLDRPGLSRPQALARAVLLAAEGAARDRRELEEAASTLRALREEMPPVARVAEFLLARVEASLEARLLAEQDREKSAASFHEDVLRALQERDPREAQRILDLLLGPALRATRYVAEKREILLVLQGQARRMMQDLRLLALFPGAAVQEPNAGPGAVEGLTRISWNLDDRVQLGGFLAPEDGVRPPGDLDPLPSPAEGVQSPGARFRFLAGPPGGPPLEALPLSWHCPFQLNKFLAVQFTWHTDRPLFLQVSVNGTHVGILTDDGTREGGRGVLAWQNEKDWRNADREYAAASDLYRREFLPKDRDLAKARTEEGLRWFQIEAGKTRLVRVEVDRGRLRLLVDREEIWNVKLRNPYLRENPPRFRILTYTPGWIDDLSVEGVVDNNYLDRLLRRR